MNFFTWEPVLQLRCVHASNLQFNKHLWNLGVPLMLMKCTLLQKSQSSKMFGIYSNNGKNLISFFVVTFGI